MKIEVFVFQCYYFCEAEWNDISLEIKALNTYSLRKAFLSEIGYFRKNHFNLLSDNQLLEKRDKMKKLWNDNKKYIAKEIVEFPLVNKRSM